MRTERTNITLALAGVCTAAAVAAVVPVMGYILLGLVLALVAVLTIAGVVALWRTRYQPPDRTRIAVPAPRTEHTRPPRVRQEVA